MLFLNLAPEPNCIKVEDVFNSTPPKRQNKTEREVSKQEFKYKPFKSSLLEHCKPAIMEKKNKNHYIQKKKTKKQKSSLLLA